MSLLLLVPGCGSRAVLIADQFASYYFVEISQEKALPLTTGLARRKLEQELQLVATVRRGGYTPEQARPSISFRRTATRVEGGRARVEYDVDVRIGSSRVQKRALVVLQHEGDSWHVSNFLVTEGASPSE